MEDNFWNDDLVNEFVNIRIHDGSPFAKTGLLNIVNRLRMGEFKKSKQQERIDFKIPSDFKEVFERYGDNPKQPPITQEKKDWEIQCIQKDEKNYWLQKDGLFNSELFGIHKSHTWLLANGGIIHSVKRISDNSVWSIDEEVGNSEGDYYTNKIIEAFLISNNELYATMKEMKGIFPLRHLTKKKPRTPLFYTDDTIPVPVYEGMRIWFVKKNNFEYGFYDFIDSGERKNDLQHYPEDFKYFSTEQAANEYILYNKKELSLNDLLSVWGDKEFPAHYKDAPLFKNFEALVKQKIKSNGISI